MNVCVFFMGFSAFISSLAFTSCLFLSPFYNYTTENSVIANIPDKQPDKISKIIVVYYEEKKCYFYIYHLSMMKRIRQNSK